MHLYRRYVGHDKQNPKSYYCESAHSNHNIESEFIIRVPIQSSRYSLEFSHRYTLHFYHAIVLEILYP